MNGLIPNRINLCFLSMLSSSILIYPQPAIVLKHVGSQQSISESELSSLNKKLMIDRFPLQLHIGFALKEGIVIHYTKQKGVTLDESWVSCWAIPSKLCPGLSNEVSKGALIDFCTELTKKENQDKEGNRKWSPEMYEEYDHNCLDFVLDCLKRTRILNNELTKSQFVEFYILPFYCDK